MMIKKRRFIFDKEQIKIKKNIKLIINKKNQGVANSRNLGIKLQRVFILHS